jgi:hypothetical protein
MTNPLMNADEQSDFDQLIGRLDRILSVMIQHATHLLCLDEPNRQTLKHHAEDMIGAGQKILECIKAKTGAIHGEGKRT